LKLGAAGVDVQLESLRALLLGGVAFDTPSPETRGEESADHHSFPLFADRDAAMNASYTRTIPAIAYFNGSVRGLAAGSEVTMHGFTVGHVTSVSLRYDRAKHEIVVPVEFEVQPERVVGLGNQVFETPAEAVNAMLALGLRASLQSTSLITGQQSVALEFQANEPPVKVVMEGKNFVLPSTESSGLSGLTGSATELLNKVNTIPFDQIGKSVNSLLLAANNLADAQQMKQSLTDLAGIIVNAKDLVRSVDSGVSPAAKQLPDLVASLQKTLTNANLLVQTLGSGYGDNTKFNRDLDRVLLQANDTLTSVRALADLLSRDPAALIKGRSDGSSK
jgi:paraquat-inducible protein B